MFRYAAKLGGVSSSASATKLAGGNLSWQAARFSSQLSLDIWLQLAANAYAAQTELAAAAVLVAGASVTGPVASDDLAGWVAAIATGAATVQTTSDYLADTLYADPTSAASLLGYSYAQNPSAPARIAGMNVVSSNGLTDSAPVVIVGASQAFVVAEDEGAPIQLRAVEPAIGGVEVGVIGGFASAVSQPEAFVSLTSGA